MTQWLYTTLSDIMRLTKWDTKYPLHVYHGLWKCRSPARPIIHKLSSWKVMDHLDGLCGGQIYPHKIRLVRPPIIWRQVNTLLLLPYIEETNWNWSGYWRKSQFSHKFEGPPSMWRKWHKIDCTTAKCHPFIAATGCGIFSPNERLVAKSSRWI